jgi:hypothetical protein
MKNNRPRIIRTRYSQPPASQRKFDSDVVWLEIKSLRLHPSQNKYLSDTTAAEQADFTADIARFGIKDPLGVLATNEIIDGRRRFYSARELCWQKVPCYVLTELRDAPEWKIDLANYFCFRH